MTTVSGCMYYICNYVKWIETLILFLQWLNDKQIVEKLIGCIVPTQDEDVSTFCKGMYLKYLCNSFINVFFI
jgi:hypothetical protein